MKSLDTNLAIEILKVNKNFKSFSESKDLLVLKNLSFKIYRGEKIAIVGLNGSGKSTLLKVIAGIIKPTSGLVNIFGRLAAILDFGSLLHPELSCKENIKLFWKLHAGEYLAHQKYEEYKAFVLEQSQLADFENMLLKFFSSGMYVRLIYALQNNLNYDILMYDEILSTGDIRFKEKTQNDESLKQKTLITVTHNIAELPNICDRVIWLDNGEVFFDGKVIDAQKAYIKKNALALNTSKFVLFPMYINEGNLVIKNIQINDQHIQSNHIIIEVSNPIKFTITIETESATKLNASIIVHDFQHKDILVSGSDYGNTQQDISPQLMQSIEVIFPSYFFNDGLFFFSFSFSTFDMKEEIVFLKNIGEFEISDHQKSYNSSQPLKLHLPWKIYNQQ